MPDQVRHDGNKIFRGGTVEHELFCKAVRYHRKTDECFCDTEMHPVGWDGIDPAIIQRVADLYDYEQAANITFTKFSRDNLARIWFSTLGWRRFFIVDWWTFKFGIGSFKKHYSDKRR